MDNRAAEAISHDLDAIFRVGVVAGLTDAQLLDQFKTATESESQLAFDAIVRRHGAMVMGHLPALLGNHHDAEDAFQATFIVLAVRAGAVRKVDRLVPGCTESPRESATERGWSKAGAGKNKSRPVDSPTPEGKTRRWPTSITCSMKSCRLPEKYREPVVLCYLEGRSQEEAARELGWTKGTVSGRLARAKALLQRRLIQRGLAPAAGLLGTSLLTKSASAAFSAPSGVDGPHRDSRELLGAENRIDYRRSGHPVRAAMTAILLGRVAGSLPSCSSLESEHRRSHASPGPRTTRAAQAAHGIARAAAPRRNLIPRTRPWTDLETRCPLMS